VLGEVRLDKPEADRLDATFRMRLHQGLSMSNQLHQ